MASLPPRQQAKVLSLAKLKDETQEKTDAEAHMLNRIVKCRDRGSNPTTPEAEAKTALALAARLMLAHNLSEVDVETQSASGNTFEGGESTVRIIATRGNSMQVNDESWVRFVAQAMNTLFDVQCFSESDHFSRKHLDRTFCGTCQNTRMAANAFEVVHNLICEWSRSKGRSRTSYCMGVAIGFKAIARKTRDEETLTAIKVDQETLKTRLAEEQAERQKQLDQLQDPRQGRADFMMKSADLDFDIANDWDDQGEDTDTDSSEYHDAVEHMPAEVINLCSESETEELGIAGDVCLSTRTEEASTKIDTNTQPTSNNTNALTLYRGQAKSIADDLMKKHGVRKYASRQYNIRDRQAYQDGKRDSNDIDIKRKRIEDGSAGDEVVGVESKRRKR